MARDAARDVALDVAIGSNYRILVRNTQTSAVCSGPADVAVRVAARVGGCEGGSSVRQASARFSLVRAFPAGALPGGAFPVRRDPNNVSAQVVLAEGALAQGVFTRAVFTQGAFTQKRIFPDAFARNIFNDSSATILRPQMKKARRIRQALINLVAGAGFEPTTFGL